MPHMHHLLIPFLHRLQSRHLGHGGSTEHGVLMDLGHGPHQIRVSQGVAYAPSGHGMGLGEAVEDDRPLLHALQLGEAGVAAGVGQLGIDLIGDYQEIVLHHHIGQLLQIGSGHDCSGGIVGVAEQQNPAFVRHRRGHILRTEPELLLQPGGYRPGHATGQDHVRGVGHIAWLGHYGLVSGIEGGPEGQVDRLTHPGGDQNLL